MLSVLKKNILILILIISQGISSRLQAQYWEIGGLLGGTGYVGDLALNPVIKETKPGINLWGRYNMSRYFSYRFGLGYGTISGHDNNFKANTTRGLSFRSNIVELSNIIEFHYNLFRHDPHNKRFTFYVLTGFNFFYFNPQAKYQGKWVDLQPLATEGQTLDGGKGRYSRIGVSIPLGAGVKYKLTPNWILGFEVAYRRAFTDYLDDVSGYYPDMDELRKKSGTAAVALSDPTTQYSAVGEGRSAKNNMRGDSHLQDWYFFTGITLSYRFTPVNCAFGQKPKRFIFD